MSIGEAETYRWYWKKAWDANLDGVPDKGAPSWLGRSNPDWLDNYKVRFWEPGWQKLIYGTPQQLPRQDYRRRLRRRVSRHHRRLRVLGLRAAGQAGAQERGAGHGRLRARPGPLRARGQGKARLRHLPAERRRRWASTPSTWRDVTGIGQEDTWYNGDACSPWTAENVPRARALRARRQAGAVHRLLPAPRAHRPLLPQGPGAWASCPTRRCATSTGWSSTRGTRPTETRRTASTGDIPD